MTILDDLAKSINKSIRDYERANPRSISLERAKEIADVKAEVDSNHTALTLRHALIQQFPSMSGAPLSLPIALDWNGLRRRLRQVLDDKKYSQMAILMVENREMHSARIQLSKTVADLTYRMERGGDVPNSHISKLEEQVAGLATRLEAQETLCAKLRVENKFLSDQLSAVERERDVYQQKLAIEEEKSKKLYQNLMKKIDELAEVKAKLDALESKVPASTNAANCPSPYAKLYQGGF